MNSAREHQFSKTQRTTIRLVPGFGIEADAHAAHFVQHCYRAKRSPQLLNLGQVHLMESELFASFAKDGFCVKPGDLGENITTAVLDLVTMPLHTRLHLGSDAAVVLSGLRVPCGYIDKFRKGLKRRMILPPSCRPRFRAGVMVTVKEGGVVYPGDKIRFIFPPKPWVDLPALS